MDFLILLASLIILKRRKKLVKGRIANYLYLLALVYFVFVLVGILYLKLYYYATPSIDDENKPLLIVILEGILLIAHDTAFFLLWFGI